MDSLSGDFHDTSYDIPMFFLFLWSFFRFLKIFSDGKGFLARMLYNFQSCWSSVIQDTYSMLVISFSVINYVVSMRVCT